MVRSDSFGIKLPSAHRPTLSNRPSLTRFGVIRSLCPSYRWTAKTGSASSSGAICGAAPSDDTCPSEAAPTKDFCPSEATSAPKATDNSDISALSPSVQWKRNFASAT